MIAQLRRYFAVSIFLKTITVSEPRLSSTLVEALNSRVDTSLAFRNLCLLNKNQTTYNLGSSKKWE